MRKLAVAAVVVVAALALTGCPPSTKGIFTFTFGNTGSEIAYGVAQLANGTWVVLGSTDTPAMGANGLDFCLVHCDATGSIDWYNTFGGTGEDVGQSVKQTADAGYVMAGWTTSPGAGTDLYVVKATELGFQSWANSLGGDGDEKAYAIQQTTDGGYIVVGSTSSGSAGGLDVYLVKLTATGSEDWSKTFGGLGDDEGFAVQQLAGGGYIVAGYTKSWGTGGADIYLFETNASGVQQWDQVLGGASDDIAHSLDLTSDGGFILGGSTASSGAGGTDAYLVKTNAAGTQLWAKVYGGSNNDDARSVQETSDGGFILGGSTASSGAGSTDLYLVKTDGSGTTQWAKTFGRSSNENGNAVVQAADGGYAIVGQTGSFGNGLDMYIVKTKSDGYGSTEPVTGS